MHTMIDNLINGNLTDAKKQAERYSHGNIIIYLFSVGYSKLESAAMAGYLKNQIAFDVYCKATEKKN